MKWLMGDFWLVLIFSPFFPFPAAMVKEKVSEANKLLIQEFESERTHHQNLVKDYARLQQRYENLHSNMEVSQGSRSL